MMKKNEAASSESGLGDDVGKKLRSDNVADKLGQERRHAKRHVEAYKNHVGGPPGRRRLKWLYTVIANPDYSRLAISVAGALAWKYSDKVTAETFVGVVELAAEVHAGKRAVQGILSTFLADGYLTKIKCRAKGRPVTYRLVIPEAPAADTTTMATGNTTTVADGKAPKQKTPASKAKSTMPVMPGDWNEFVAYCFAWLNAERDNAAVKARWNSETEMKLRNKVCGDNEDIANFCDAMLEQRLRYGRCRMLEEDETAF
jgi:hypothetical protein